MADIGKKLTRLIEAKEDIKQALLEKSVIPSGGLETYGNAIRNMVTIRDFIAVNHDSLNTLTIGESFDCCLCNINTDTGYIFGYDGKNNIQSTSGFRTNSRLITTVNNYIERPEYIFTITKEADEDPSKYKKVFTFSGANMTNRTEGSGIYGLSYKYLQLSANRGATTTNNITIEYSGRYPTDIYVGVTDNSNNANAEILDADGNQIANSDEGFTISSNLRNWKKYTITGPTTLTFKLVNTSTSILAGAVNGQFYVCANDVIELFDSVAKFSIKHKETGKYLSFDENGNISFTDEKFILIIYKKDESGPRFVEPNEYSVNNLLTIVHNTLWKYLSSEGVNSNELVESLDSTTYWGLFRLLDNE